MKINNITEISGPDLPRHAPGVTPGPSADKPVAGVTETDRIELSETSRLAQTPADKDDVRAEKVAQVKNAIARGEFQVDVSAVADRMISEAASLVEMISAFETLAREGEQGPTNSQEKFGAGPANTRTAGPDR